MTTSPPSASDPATAFDRLHPQVRRWIRDQGWDELRDVQTRTIDAVLSQQGDVLIAASTAAGKTEAAFLPAMTAVADRPGRGLAILYISPLKALINDQFRRLETLCDRMEMGAVRWHGDAPQAAKARVLRNPQGIALITPESIEALLIRRRGDAQVLLGALDFIIIDELHAFMQGARGLQLSSLLNRIDALAGRRARRVGLSATIGDLKLAAAWLNPDAPDTVTVVESGTDSPELRLQIRGYIRGPEEGGGDDLEDEDRPVALDRIADHAFSVLRGTNNLVFGNSRRSVEALADRLRRRSEAANVPNEFFPHHGSLSKELREGLEGRLKDQSLPTTAIATTTLELGIDIGSVASVATLGAPRSLSSLRQRLGRSGRRKGSPAALRIYVREPALAADIDVLDRLRLDVVRAVAATRLLMERFVEPPRRDPALASTALHQTLAIIAERGGARADVLYDLICAPGPFADLTKADYVGLLRQMADPEVRLIEQAPDGLIMLGEVGERLVAGRDFYAVFESDDEWRLIAGGRTLGVIPLSNIVGEGSLLAFAGRRWRVTAVDEPAKVIEVVAHRAGKLPTFDKLATEPIHDRLSMEMLAVYSLDDEPAWLDTVARQLLKEGRDAFRALNLDRRRLLESGRDTHVLTWRGSAANAVLAVVLTAAGLPSEAHGVGVTVADASTTQVTLALSGMYQAPDPRQISGFVANLQAAKYDGFVPESLLRKGWAHSNAQACADIPALVSEILTSPIS